MNAHCTQAQYSNSKNNKNWKVPTRAHNSVEVFKVNQIWVPMHECQHLPITIRQVIKWRWLPTMVPGCSFWSKLTLSFECTKVRSLCDDGLCGGLVQQRGPGRGRGGQVGSAADMLTMLDIFQIGEHNTHANWCLNVGFLPVFKGGLTTRFDPPPNGFRELKHPRSSTNVCTKTKMFLKIFFDIRFRSEGE